MARKLWQTTLRIWKPYKLFSASDHLAQTHRLATPYPSPMRFRYWTTWPKQNNHVAAWDFRTLFLDTTLYHVGHMPHLNWLSTWTATQKCHVNTLDRPSYVNYPYLKKCKSALNVPLWANVQMNSCARTYGLLFFTTNTTNKNKKINTKWTHRNIHLKSEQKSIRLAHIVKTDFFSKLYC